MNPKVQIPPPSPGITVGDVLYIVFRHKWLIIVLALVSIIAAITVRMFWPLPYQSEAELLIKYVKDTKPPELNTPGTQVSSADARGENIINSEIAILTSMDLAKEVVQQMGASNILGKSASNDIEAAAFIHHSLKPEVGNRSDVIGLVFSHPKLEMVQPVLKQVIETYLKMHNEIHQPQYNDYLSRLADETKHKLDVTEGQLRDAETKAGVLDVSDGKKTYGEMIGKIQNEIYDAETEHAAVDATIKEMQTLLPPSPSGLPSNTSAMTSNAPAAVPIPADVLSDYQDLLDQKNRLETEGQSLRRTYAPGNSMVTANQSQLTDVNKQKREMEKKYPALLAVKAPDSKSNGAVAALGPDPRVALNDEIIKAKAAYARLQMLTNLMAQIHTNASVLTSMEGTISQLERDRTSEEADLNFYRNTLNQSQANGLLLQDNSNISIVESPTPPTKDAAKLMKACLGIFFGGLALAFGLPFLIELYLDRSLKHPLEVQSRLGLPFFISIPLLNGKGNRNGAVKPRKSLRERTVALLPAGEDEISDPGTSDSTTNGANANGHHNLPAPVMDRPLAVWEHGHELQQHYEALRDRLMTYFEMINLTHKPKLVAVTSCESGAGVTSTAAGLAKSLSETGEGNVLLVNMSARDGEAHHFYKGQLNGLDDVFDKGASNSEPLQDRLYVAKEQATDENLPRVLPKRFSHLLPKMKASEFDYIIFDMPPVSQISITPRLARFMDMVLLVVESGKTDRDVARRVTGILSETKTNVGIVLNKYRSHGPRRLQHDI
jgi:uncharacterized protein involved in exopolysaccharide biosynthesis/Mrp family chromosome partitioning ATPase